MKLSLLIPTYNRCRDLEHNLSALISFIANLPNPEDVCIIISDNASIDDTCLVIEKIKDKSSVKINYIRQETNIGYSKNVCFLLSSATTEWVMLLGDDDYLEPWYISECLKQIGEHPNLGCIIPNYIDYYPATDTYGELREENCETEYYKVGFDACYQNAWRGHQLSGLCFRREGLIDAFRENKMDNMYPQIFFVAYNALRYDVLHFGQKCLCVSGVPQSQKDWGYGEDGLINDVFENFKHLNITHKQRALLELRFITTEKRYHWATKNRNLCIEKILTGKNVSYLGRYYIALHILHEQEYYGKRLRLYFYVLARFVLLRKLLTGQQIVL